MEQEKKISQYNEAQLQVFRLGDIWNDCNYHKSSGNLRAYKIDLENAHDELSYDVERLDKNISNEKEKYSYKLKIINFYILQALYLKRPLTFYHRLQEKHRLLRHIQEAAGKGGKLKDEDEDDFD